METRTADHRVIEVQTTSGQVDSKDTGNLQLEHTILVRRKNHIVISRVTEDLVAGHLDVEGVLLAVAESISNDPEGTLTTTGETLESIAVLSPDQALAISIPLEL